MALRNISNNQHALEFIVDHPLISESSKGAQTTTSTTTSTSSSSQIRTSSPISSPSMDLDQMVGADPFVAQPITRHPRFHRAIQSSQSLKQAIMDQPAPTVMPKYPSMRELAYRKLREANMKNIDYEQCDRIRSKGRLKLAVYANMQTHLTVHIVEAMSANSLKSVDNNAPAYVKITQIPEDGERRLVVKTRIVESVDHRYHFNDKFSFEICQLNPSNRLVFGLWTINSSSQDHLVGCFSFRIKNLLSSAFSRSHESRSTPYWYHLLPTDVGLNRHVKCSSHPRSQSKPNHGHNIINPTANNNFPEVNSDLQGMYHVTLTLVKSSEDQSYGFTITNSCPCTVSKVGVNSVAYRAGLRCGDFISRVNDVNVSRASCESVVKMIKQSKSRLIIEVYREQTDPRPIENYQMRPMRTSNLEMVPEEDAGSDHGFEGDHFARVYASLKYVDSVTSPSSDDEDDDNEAAAVDRLRRAAVQYVNAGAVQMRCPSYHAYHH